ncbi:hypothetical protein N9087_00370 [bacterium]|nr:hypothetical protein [bacterium]
MSLVLGPLRSVGDSDVGALFRVGLSTGARSLPVAPVGGADVAGELEADGEIGGASVGGGPVSGVRLGLAGCIPTVPVGAIDGIGIAW